LLSVLAGAVVWMDLIVTNVYAGLLIYFIALCVAILLFIIYYWSPTPLTINYFMPYH